MKKFLFKALEVIGTAALTAGMTMLFREAYDEWKYGRMNQRVEKKNKKETREAA